MSLPPGFLDELRTRTSMSQVAGRKVMWDSRKSNQGKGDMWAPCPFHQEKTASFHVDDQKGYYYCFGCHAKGDAISFVRETENVGFMEAIEILAQEAGMPVPKRDPQAQQKADRRTELAAVMEQAVQYYRLQLKTAIAGPARDYLARRGLSEEAQARWEIGFAPDARQGIYQAMTQKGTAVDLVVDTGLCAQPDDGGAPFDRFRDRIIFPIRDARGRAIALGGRAMAADARAKYLNSPETELFDKGRSLFNHAPAREAAGKGQPLIVAEGYMDVIALSEAGFTASVAPLGTAITEDQLRLMWRIHPEPIIALDGDTAGLRAAMRVIDIALPLLEAGQSLRFALMPEGQDPDDLLKAQGAEAMQALLDTALPMVRLLWRRETEGKVFDSPERKAALDKGLREAIRKIADPSVRAHYGDEIKALRQELFAQGRPKSRREWVPGGKWRGAQQPMSALPATKSSLLGAASGAVEDHLREGVILAMLILHPTIVERFEGELEMLELNSDEHKALRDCLLRGMDRAEIEQQLGPAPLEKLFAPAHVQLAPAVRNPNDPELAVLCVAEELAKLAAKRGARRDIEEAASDMAHMVDEGLTWRLTEAAKAMEQASKSQTEDNTEYDTHANGARISRAEKSAFDALLDRISQGKPKQRSPRSE